MRAKLLLLFVLIFTPFTLLAESALNAEQEGAEYLPPDQAFRLEHQVEDGQLRLNWQIAEGYYLYRDKIRLHAGDAAVELGQARLSAAQIKQDPYFGAVPIYHAEASLSLALDALAGEQLKVRYQGCAEQGLCYPPQIRRIDLTGLALPMVADAVPVVAPAVSKDFAADSDQGIAQRMAQQGAGWVILSFFGFGILLALTPCVLPMLPILSGLIVGQGAQVTTRRAFMLSATYVLAMAASYTVAGMAAALAGRNLQAAMQHPAVLGSFAGLFVLLALSMFDVFQLQLPSSLQTRLDGLSRKQQGGSLLGAAVMGVLGALIVGPCVAPPLAGALLYIAQSGDVLLGGAALFALGLGMGVPLVAAGTAAGKLLPRAGMWMESVKQVFGVLMLIVALLLLERILPAFWLLLLWAALLTGIGVRLGALGSAPASESGMRHLARGLGIMLLVAGQAELIGALGGASDIREPLGFLQQASATQPVAAQQAESVQVVSSLKELEALIMAADKPLVADVYADWCTSCRAFEREVLATPEVQRKLGEFQLVKVDVTTTTPEVQALQSRFQLIGPPALLSFAPGQKVPRQRRVGELDKAGFLDWLAAAGETRV